MSGLEILATLASSIAVAQAMLAGRSVVSLIRRIPEIRSECDALRDDIDLIGELIKGVRKTSESLCHEEDAAERLDHHLIDRSSQKVSEIVDELGKVLDSCTEKIDDNKWNIKRWRWVQKENQIRMLRLKAESAKSTLYMALIHLTNQQLAINTRLITTKMATISLKQVESQREILRRFELLAHTNSQIPLPSISHRIKELPDSLQDEEGNSTSVTVGKELEMTPKSLLHGEKQRGSDSMGRTQPEQGQNRQERRSTAMPNTRSHTAYKQDNSFEHDNSFVQFQHILPIGKCKCSPDCGCRCHFSQRRFQTPGWLQPVLGSCLVSYSLVHGIGRQKCNQTECKRDNSYLRLEYRLPKRIFPRLLSIQALYGSVMSLGLSLRPARVLPLDDIVWTHICGDRVQLLHCLVQEGVTLFPDDRRDDNYGLLEGLPRAVAIEANQAMIDDLSDEQVQLLKQARSWVDDEELKSTNLHRAVMLGYGVPKVLEEEPWAIDQFDNEGYTPFQLAALHNQMECLELLIAAQADINQTDWGGRTALMLTAYWGHGACMQRLLRANCRVDQQDDSGQTALHYAMWGGSGAAVALLLAAGASPMKRQKWGQTPLQLLSRSKADEKTADEIVHLLLVKHVDPCAAADMTGITPALDALYYTNMPVLRSLVKAGASLYTTDRRSQSMLHYAARFCNLDMLRYLNTLGLGGISTELCDSDGRTPWGNFCHLIQAPDWELVGPERSPSLEEQDAFVDLYNKILLQNLQNEIDILTKLHYAAGQQDKAASAIHLGALVRQKEYWKEPGLVAWYRGVDGLIRGGCWESAVAELEDILDELHLKKRSSPRELNL